jgi:hypothetical protein
MQWFPLFVWASIFPWRRLELELLLQMKQKVDQLKFGLRVKLSEVESGWIVNDYFSAVPSGAMTRTIKLTAVSGFQMIKHSLGAGVSSPTSNT